MRATGPSTPPWERNSSSPSPGTRPSEGRRPSTLFQPVGLRSEPKKSLPSATGTIRRATATAAPPLLPPAVRVWSQAFRVVPKTWL